MTKQRDTDIVRQMKDRGVFEPEAFERFLAAKGWSWQALDRGEYEGLDLQGALTLFVFQDPVRWCETFLLNPDDGEPWRFFDYQKASVRAWDQDVVHQDGAEVGKTREIIALILWAMCTSFGLTRSRPGILVGAPQQGHLDEIISAVEEQMGVAEGMEDRSNPLRSFWMKPKKSPYTTLKFKCPNAKNPRKPMVGRVYFRPAAHDGQAFRGVHVNGIAFFDEAAKAKHNVIWDEFSRAMLPGCRERVYSVSDGDNTTRYYALTQMAVRNLPPGEDGYRLFHWPKNIMPAPFWNEEREREFRRRYKGRNTPGYQRNVLGLHGQAENPVWSVDTLLPNITDLPDYRALCLTVEGNNLNIELKRIAMEYHIGDKAKAPREEWLEDSTIGLEDFQHGDEALREAMRELLRSRLPSGGDGIYWAGADLGEKRDPTEILLAQEMGAKIQDRIRIHAQGMPYYLQRELVYCLDELFGFRAHWGVDLGGAGTVVVRDLQTMDAYAEAHYDERLTGFNFSENVDCLGEDGETLTRQDDRGDDKPVRARAKHWSTQLITQRMQTVGYAMAYDPPVIGHYENHTAREGAREPIYAKTDDHTIDARRVLMLRKVFDEDSGVDVFSSGVHRRNAA